MVKPTWEINWDKVETVEDLKDIFKSIRLGFHGDLNEFPLIEHLLTLKYPEEIHD